MTSRRPLRTAALLPVLLGLLLGVAGCGAGQASSSSPAAGPSGAGRSETPYALPPCPTLTPAAPVPGGLPDLRLPCLGEGPAVRLSDLRGKPLVLNVWAAWCTICQEEMPVLAQGVRRAGDRVRFFGIHYKAPRAYGQRSAADFGVPFPSVQDEDGDRTVAALRTTAPPQTLFVTADGRIAGRQVGAIRSEAELAGLVQRYLGVRL